MDPVQSDAFEALIDEWLLTAESDIDIEIEPVVRQHRVLPILATIGGAFLFQNV